MGDTTTVDHVPGAGWRPDEDFDQDPTHDDPDVRALLRRTGVNEAIEGRAELPDAVDDSRYCGPIKFQGRFNTCTAHVAVAMLEFFEKKASGKLVEGSRLFLYKAVKNLLQEKGDVSAFLRQTLGALSLVGLPPEKYWPYLEAGTLENPNSVDPRIDAEPPAFCYAIARDYRSLLSYRIDQAGLLGSDEVIHRAKTHLAAGIPVSLGIRLFKSITTQARESGEIPLPAPEDDPHIADHAVLIVGYDDAKSITNTLPGGPSATGAFKIQNSWSTGWGDEGFGWVPYQYVTAEGIGGDMWTLLKADWVESGAFDLAL